MQKQLYQTIIIVLIFLLAACSGNNTKTATNLPSANAKLLPVNIESGKIEGQKLKIEFPCLNMGKMDYFSITIIGDSGYSKAFLKKTDTKIETDENGIPISKIIIEYLAEKNLETIGNLLMLLEGEVHPQKFQKVAFKKEQELNATDWLTPSFQTPLAKTLRGNRENIDKCYGYQWQEKSNQTILFRKVAIKGQCQTSSTKIDLNKMTNQTFQEFNLLENTEAQILYWNNQLVFVSQGEYSEAAAKPMYSFIANGQTNYITYFGVKRKNLYGLLNIEGKTIRLDLFPSC